MRVQIDTSELRAFRQTLIELQKKDSVRAVRATLNAMAEATRGGARKTLAQDFTLRNKFTTNSLRTTQANQKSISRLNARTGTIQPYLATQEEGGKKGPKSGGKIKIATNASVGKSGTGTRKKIPGPGYRPGTSLPVAPMVTPRNPSGGPKQQLAVQALLALQWGRRYFMWNSGKHEGLYRVTGQLAPRERRKPTYQKAQPRPKRKRYSDLKIDLIYDMTRSSASVPKEEWMLQAIHALRPDLLLARGIASAFTKKGRK